MAFLLASSVESNDAFTVEKARGLEAEWDAKHALRPNLSTALNVAVIAYTIGKGEKARQAIEALLGEIDGENVPPDMLAQIYMNAGMIYRGFGELGTAAKLIEASWNCSRTGICGLAYAEELLRAGKWLEGWPLHNKTRPTLEGSALGLGLDSSCKYWDGTETPRSLLVINEGGAGDRINYSRFLPELDKLGIPYKFFCFDALKPLYEKLPWLDGKLIGEHDKFEMSPPPSHWTTVFALPEALKIAPETVPSFPTPFVAPRQELKLQGSGKPKIGICWEAAELFQGGLRVRSISAAQAMRLVAKTDDLVDWVSVQHGSQADYPIANVPFQTWADTAELLSQLDALVSVDTATYHLAGAMGVPTALILTSNSDWKWGYGGKDIWYPSVQVFRNGPSTRAQDADFAINEIIAAIREEKFPAWPPRHWPICKCGKKCCRYYETICHDCSTLNRPKALQATNSQ